MKNINSLIIGSTSQLAHYLPKQFERISSNNIRENLPLPLREEFYDRVYITIAEQRLHEIKAYDAYIDVNYTKTLKLINFFRGKANKIVVYGTCELWNNYQGPIQLSDPFNYDLHSPYAAYCISKHMLTNAIANMENVIILHPFNFNSIYRKPGFLFSKIFDSIKNRKKIEIGDTYFYRDLLHAKYVAERSMLAEESEIVGSGRIVFVNDFIRQLYYHYHMQYEDYVTENFSNSSQNKKILYLKSDKCLYSYNNLIQDTLIDYGTQL